MMRQFKEYAKTLQTTDMESFWLFIYETLPASDLRDYWKAMKKEKVSFLMDF